MQWLTEDDGEELELTALQPQVHAQHNLLGGRFVRGEPLAGPAGTIFAGREAVSGDPVTIRYLRLRGHVPDAALTHLRQDIHRVATELRPYLVRVRAFDWQDDVLALVTEPVGTSLATTLATRRLTLDEALSYGRHVTSALAHAHAHHVAHGLLTPASVDLLAPDKSPASSQPGMGTARLGEFGLVHLAPYLLLPLPADGAVRRGYRAPEEWRGAAPSAAGDVFHLGALFWELALGTPPPTNEPLAARGQLAVLPPDWQEIILACLAPEPSHRPTKLDGILSELRAIQRMVQGKASTHVVERYRSARLGASQPDPLDTAPHVSVAVPRPRRQTNPIPEDSTIELPTYLASHEQSTSEHQAQPLQTARQRIRRLSQPQRIMALGATAACLVILSILAIGLSGLRTTSAAPPDDVILRQGVTSLTARSAPYHVTHTLSLGPGQTLRLAPGVTLLFAPGTGIELRGGALDAQGTDQQPITFSGAETAGTWTGIHLSAAADGTTGHAVLTHVALRYAGTTSSAALRCEAGALMLSASTQSDSLGDGLLASKQCWGEVARNTFAHDGAKAADIASSTLKFHDNDVQGLPISVP